MIALQVRGGPEPYMVSSWVQILRARASDAGVYSCTVVSKKGIVRAEATVQVTKVSSCLSHYIMYSFVGCFARLKCETEMNSRETCFKCSSSA